LKSKDSRVEDGGMELKYLEGNGYVCGKGAVANQTKLLITPNK
jgi:hypothetical protein